MDVYEAIIARNLSGGSGGGGGGSLDYVIPEQTVTFSNGSANISNIDASSLTTGDRIIVKIIIEDEIIYNNATYTTNTIAFDDTSIGQINVETGAWTTEAIESSVIVSAIRGF